MSVVAALMGCGGGGGDGNNDQGIVFRAVGFVRGPESIDADQIRCTEPTTQNAIIDTSWPIALDSTRWFPDRNDPFNDPCGGFIALENNLAVQAINVQQIIVTYEIPGAAIAPPQTTIFTGVRINSANSMDESQSGQPNLIYEQLNAQMLPATILQWIAQFQNDLPVTPFQLIAEFEAFGQSDSGTRYIANPISYTFTVTDTRF